MISMDLSMGIDGAVIVGLLAIMAFATYFQTVTGFGLSVIVIGVTSGLDLVPLPLAASVVSLVSLANCLLALPPSKWRQVDWRVTGFVLAGAIPASIAGVIVLNNISHSATLFLQFALGVVIVASGVQTVFKPEPLATQSSRASFGGWGAVAGLCGGIFGMPGPPIIFVMYRQPFSIDAIRTALLVIFLFISLSRMAYLGAEQGVDVDAYIIAGVSLPLIMLMTWMGHRFPPRMSPTTIRRGTFMILVGIGVGLIVPVLFAR